MWIDLPPPPYVMMMHSDKKQEQICMVLYSSPGCFYCQKVINYLQSIHKTIPMKNPWTNEKAYQELITIGGKSQVPCLILEGKTAIYDSDAIIQWLEAHKEQLPDGNFSP